MIISMKIKGISLICVAIIIILWRLALFLKISCLINRLAASGLAHPEQERSKQKTPCARNLPMAVKKSSGLGHRTAQETFAPLGGADSSTKKHKIGRPVPAAQLEIGGTERYGKWCKRG